MCGHHSPITGDGDTGDQWTLKSGVVSQTQAIALEQLGGMRAQHLVRARRSETIALSEHRWSKLHLGMYDRTGDGLVAQCRKGRRRTAGHGLTAAPKLERDRFHG